MTIIIYESSCKHEQLNGKYEKKNRVQLTSLGVHLILKSKWKYDFFPHYHAICYINWMGLDSRKYFPFEENIWDFSSLDTIYCSFAMI